VKMIPSPFYFFDAGNVPYIHSVKYEEKSEEIGKEIKKKHKLNNQNEK
jgi:hypothetical protein